MLSLPDAIAICAVVAPITAKVWQSGRSQNDGLSVREMVALMAEVQNLIRAFNEFKSDVKQELEALKTRLS